MTALLHRNPRTLTAVDMVAVMQGGRLTAFGPKEEVLQSQFQPRSVPQHAEGRQQPEPQVAVAAAPGPRLLGHAPQPRHAVVGRVRPQARLGPADQPALLGHHQEEQAVDQLEHLFHRHPSEPGVSTCAVEIGFGHTGHHAHGPGPRLFELGHQVL